jgi:hypothetical protein
MLVNERGVEVDSPTLWGMPKLLPVPGRYLIKVYLTAKVH